MISCCVRGSRYNRRPTGSLDGGRRLVQLQFEGIEAAEIASDGRGQLAAGRTAALGTQVLPENAVQDMARDVEGQGAFQHAGAIKCALLPGFGQLFESLVGAIDIGPCDACCDAAP